MGQEAISLLFTVCLYEAFFALFSQVTAASRCYHCCDHCCHTCDCQKSNQWKGLIGQNLGKVVAVCLSVVKSVC